METYTPKGFFDKPEGKTGMVFIVIGIFVFLVFGNTIMPYIISALENTIHAAILGGIVLGAIALVMNKKFRLLVWNLYKSGMRLLTSMFVTIDPIGIMKNYIEYMGDQIEDMDKQIGVLGGNKQKLIRIINERKEIAENTAKLAKVAHDKENQDQYSLNIRKAQRAIDFVDKLNVTLDAMERIYKFLDKMKRNVGLLLEDTKDEVETREIEYTSIKAAHKAMSSARKLIAGDDARQLFEQSMEFVADDIAKKIGEMERAMEASKNFMESCDLTNGVWDEEGLKILESLDKGGSLFSYERTKSPVRGLTANHKATSCMPTSMGTTSVNEITNPKFDTFFKPKV